jgi:cytochrome c-type biogenesis protein CcmH
MTRLRPALAIGAAIGVLALAVGVVTQPGSEPTGAERADAVARQLRCPDCQGLSVADSPTGSAREIRRQVDELIAGGATDDEVRAHFVARYGEWILLAPRAPAAWIIPFAVVLGGAVALAAWLMGRSKPTAAEPLVLTADERRRLRDEAEALDA